ncbi:MAG TPA: DUF4390 domain-containing protein [Desulfobulbus sp.]|nr:DUF4390 domain-containing protein [Desulfobulbus sp.]
MKPTLFRPGILLLLLALILPLPAAGSQDKTPTITDIIITTSASDLLLFATVKNSFTPEMEKGVKNGIPISFSFKVELDKVRNFWPDATLVEKEIVHRLTYDSLKEEYSVELAEKHRTEVTRSLARAEQLMSELNGLIVIARKKLVPDASYVLRIKATLVKTTLPLGMHYVLPFTSLWDFETDWRTIEFRY